MTRWPHIHAAERMGHHVTFSDTSDGRVALLRIGGGEIAGQPGRDIEERLDNLEHRLAEERDRGGDEAERAMERGDFETAYRLLGEIGQARTR